MNIETILKIEDNVVKKQNDIILSYEIYKSINNDVLYFVRKDTDNVSFKIDKNLNITKI